MRRIVVRMSRRAVMDLRLEEGGDFAHGDRIGRVVGMKLAGPDILVEVEVDGPVALTGVPGEPPVADDA